MVVVGVGVEDTVVAGRVVVIGGNEVVGAKVVVGGNVVVGTAVVVRGWVETIVVTGVVLGSKRHIT